MSDPLRILLLTPAVPYPPTQGASLRNYHILRGLTAAHRVTLLSFALHPPTAAETAHLESLCESFSHVPLPARPTRQRLTDLLTSRYPDMGHRLHDPQFMALLERTLATPFDVVQIEGIELARTLPLIQEKQPHARIVFDNHNAEADLQWRTFLTDVKKPRRWLAALYSLAQVAKLRPFERWICRAADAVTAVSDADARLIQQLAAPLPRPVTVIPNTIDLTHYRTEMMPNDPQFDLVFTGKMDYRPNVDAMTWFLADIWPRIIAQRPQTTLAIVGQTPHPLVEAAAARAGANVTLTGFVPEVTPYLAGAKLVIMPLRMGSGTRLKLLEALASEKAVVSTRTGAEGFKLVDGEQIALADSAAEFGQKTLFLLENEGAREALKGSGRLFAGRYDWREVVPQFLALYRALGIG